MHQIRSQHGNALRNRIVSVALLTIGLSAFAGCAKQNMGPAGTTEDAESLLTVALDSWKAGMKPEELLTEDPKVHVADQDWQAGTVLKDYAFAGNAIKFGGTWRVPAVLTLSSPDQSEMKKKAAYEITMDPAITILRSDENVD